MERVAAELSRLKIESIVEEKTYKTNPMFNVNLNKIGAYYNSHISNSGQGNAYNVNLKIIDFNDSPLSTCELKDMFPHQEMKPYEISS